jgi:hypothetical protein
VFVLNACAYEVIFYSWNPYHLAAIALLFGINCMEKEFETKLGKDPHNPTTSKQKFASEASVETVLTTQKMNWEAAQAKMAELRNLLGDGPNKSDRAGLPSFGQFVPAELKRRLENCRDVIKSFNFLKSYKRFKIFTNSYFPN